MIYHSESKGEVEIASMNTSWLANSAKKILMSTYDLTWPLELREKYGTIDAKEVLEAMIDELASRVPAKATQAKLDALVAAVRAELDRGVPDGEEDSGQAARLHNAWHEATR